MNTDRITEMERRLEKAEAAVSAMEAAVEQYEAVQEDIRVLDEYLGSEAWHTDRADDEAGRLPNGFKRGVLSEDAVWNLLERHRELRERLANQNIFCHLTKS